jgi:hypothetical protein
MSMAQFKVFKQWRGVGNDEYDIFHRDTRRELMQCGVANENEIQEVWSVMQSRPPRGDEKPEDAFTVIADCYSRKDANGIAALLNGESALSRISAAWKEFKDKYERMGFGMGEEIVKLDVVIKGR